MTILVFMKPFNEGTLYFENLKKIGYDKEEKHVDGH